MTGSHDANKAIGEQRLCADLWAGGLPHHARFEIDDAIAKRCILFVGFLYEAHLHARSLLADTSDETRAEVLDKAFAGTNRECSGDYNSLNHYLAIGW